MRLKAMASVLLLVLLLVGASAHAFSRSSRITQSGLGVVHIGTTVTRVETALGHSLSDLDNTVGGGSCSTATLGDHVFGLFTKRLLARIYVDTPRYATSGGVRVGQSAARVFASYRSVKSAPHAYVRGGHYLTITTGQRRLLFETNAAGRITSISTGRIPEVDYIEGCA